MKVNISQFAIIPRQFTMLDELSYIFQMHFTHLIVRFLRECVKIAHIIKQFSTLFETHPLPTRTLGESFYASKFKMIQTRTYGTAIHGNHLLKLTSP